MESIRYLLIALRYDSSMHFMRYVDRLKDQINSINYTAIKDSDTRILLYNISNSSIQIILRIPSKPIELKENLIMIFKEELNKEVTYILQQKKDINLEVFYEIELDESLVNKMILTMKRTKKKEFDLLGAVKFNEGIKKLLKESLENELRLSRDKNSESRFRNKFKENQDNRKLELKYNTYNKENLNNAIEEIQSSVVINLDIKSELKLIKNICNKLNSNISYILNVEHLGLYELEIAKIILSEQYKLKLFKEPTFDTTTLDEIINPHISFFGNSRAEEIKLDFYNKNMAIIIRDINQLDKIDDLQLNKLINFINREPVPFILLIDQSKTVKNTRYNRNLVKLKQSIISREIKINQPTSEMFFSKISKEIENKKYQIDESVNEKESIKCIEEQYSKNYNMNMVKQIANKIIYKHEIKDSGKTIYSFDVYEDFNQDSNKKAEETGLEKLEKMIGLDNLKIKVKEFISLNKVNEIRRKSGLPAEEIFKHMCLKGNPGSGKTTFARIFAQIMKEEGLLEVGDLIEVSRDDLIAKYVGWTAKTVTEHFEKAKGSILFIDEAYLLNTDDCGGYGAEAIGAIVNNMENYKDVIVIMAGYPLEMDAFIKSNPGMASRIGLHINMKDFTVNELLDIFISFTKERKYEVNKDVLKKIRNHLSIVKSNKSRDFGNGRYVRRLFERIQLSQAKRIAGIKNIGDTELVKIIIEDVTFLDAEEDFHLKENIKQIGFIP